jgi:hypothetical protein
LPERGKDDYAVAPQKDAAAKLLNAHQDRKENSDA